jgi:hypothetical protein
MKIKNIKNPYLMYAFLFLKYFIAINILNLILIILCIIFLFINFGMINPSIIRLIMNTILPSFVIIYFLLKNISRRDKPMICFCVFLIVYQILYEPFITIDVFYDNQKSYLSNFIESFKKTYSEPFEHYEHQF